MNCLTMRTQNAREGTDEDAASAINSREDDRCDEDERHHAAETSKQSEERSEHNTKSTDNRIALVNVDRCIDYRKAAKSSYRLRKKK